MKRFFLFLVAFSFMSNVFGEQVASSGPFYFSGGIIPPKGILTLSLKSLPAGPNLDLSCDIENPNYFKEYPVVLGFAGTLNGKGSSTFLYLLDNQTSKYARRMIVDYNSPGTGSLNFKNYDDTDAVYVQNCMAIYATS